MELNGLPPINIGLGLNLGDGKADIAEHNADAEAHSGLFSGKQNTIAATGMLKGAGSGSVSAAVEGMDYVGVEGGKAIPERISADIVTTTSNTTLGLTHAGMRVEMNSTSARTITIPADSNVNFPIGTEIEISREGTGAVTIAPASGVTLTSPDGMRAISSRYGIAILKKRAADNWRLNGDLE